MLELTRIASGRKLILSAIWLKNYCMVILEKLMRMTEITTGRKDLI